MSVKRNLLYNILYQILILIIPLVTTPYISRVLGPDAIGAQSYTNSIVNYFVLFAMLGINNYGNRSIAMSKDNKQMLNKTFVSIYTLQVVMSLIMLIFYGITLFFVNKEYKILFLIQSLYIIATMLDINWFFFGMEEFKLTVVRNTIIKVISMISVFLFVKDVGDIYIYSFILALGVLISNLVLWKFIRQHIEYTKVSTKDIIHHIKPILVLFIPVIAVSLYKTMDKIMLGSISGTTQVGFYTNSEKIISIPLSIITAVGAVMLPKMSNLESKGNIDESKKYISISMEFIMVVAYGAMFGLLGISDILIPIFLGSGFEPCIKILMLLSITLIFLSWANIIRMQYLIPKKKDKIYIKSTILGAIVNLIVNFALIGKYGAIGAAIGTIFAELSVALYQTLKVRKELDIVGYLLKSIFYIVPGFLMYLLVSYIGNKLPISVVTLIVQVSIGGILYIIISLIYMYITKNEIIHGMVQKVKYRVNLNKNY